MIDIAVTGTGMLVHEILPVLTNLKSRGININALCGTLRSEETVKKLCADYGISKFFTDFDAMLQSLDKAKTQAVYIATPNNTHFAMAKKALDRGFNVILEKPFVPTVKEAEELIATARKNDLILLEAISNQYLEIYASVKKNLNLLGDIKYVGCNFSQYSSRYDRFKAGEYFKVFDRKEGGGALMDINVYNIHLVTGLFGLPSSIKYYPNVEKQVDTSGVLMMDYGSFKAECVGAKDCQGPSSFLIQGTKGYLKIEAPANTLAGELLYYNNEDKQTAVLFSPDKDQHRITAEFLSFEKILSGHDTKERDSRLDETLNVVKLLEEAQKW